MKVKILRNTVANKRPVEVGEIIDLPDAEARFLIAIGKAEAVKLSKKAIEEAVIEAPEQAVTRKKGKGKRGGSKK